MKAVNIITLGCSKNIVDSEYILKQLHNGGYTVYSDQPASSAKIVLINTCGFINDAKQESIEMILHYENLKMQGKIEKIIVFGCLSERYKKDLQKEIPGIDHFFGVYEQKKLLKALGIDQKENLMHERILTTPPHYAYHKISEGCDRKCSFCAIPLIKGPYKSKSIDELTSEAKILVKSGVKEILLIAQDLTYYGADLYNQFKLPELVEKMSSIRGLEWLRLHYTYPSKFPLELLKIMKDKANVCNYLDIPFQHISDNVLKKMRRGITKKQTYELLEKIRKEIPGIALRTTMLVGHPGEEEEDFDELYEFVKEQQFDRLGIFTYSEEENTYAAKNFRDEIPFTIKQARASEIMDLQRSIALQKNSMLIGKELKTIIDREDDNFFIGRTEYDSPEVDNEVLVKKNRLIKAGNFYDIRITDHMEYDLMGELKK